MSGFDPMQRRDWHGRWTDTGNEGGVPKWRRDLRAEEDSGEDDEEDDKHLAGGAAREGDGVLEIIDGKVIPAPNNEEVTLPPSRPNERRNDEIASLLEWIANARRQDWKEINAEINRIFTDVGDNPGGVQARWFLAEIIKSGGTRQERQALLEKYAELLVDRDPVAIGDLIREELLGRGRGRLGAIRSAPDAGTPRAAPRSAATKATPRPVPRHAYWDLGWSLRGKKIETLYGGNLTEFYPIVDRCRNKTATSIKTVDLEGRSYKSGTRLSRLLNSYVDKVSRFQGACDLGKELGKVDIDQLELLVVVPKGSQTAAQRQVIDAARKRAEKRGIKFTISEL